MSQSNNLANEKERLFQSLLSQAKKQGYLSAETVIKRYGKYQLSEEETENLFLGFENEGVNLVFDDNDDFPDETEPEKVTDAAGYTDDIVTLYLREIRDLPVLTHKETLLLVREIAEGNEKARDYLIRCNLRFAFSIAVKYMKSQVPLPDLIQQANLGLLDAVDRYNPNRGTKFTTYAVFWIRNSICQYISGQANHIKLPVCITSEQRKIQSFKDSYRASHQSEPSDDEIATGTGLSIARVKKLRNYEFNVVSTDSQPTEDMDGTVLDTIASEEEESDPLKKYMRDDLRKSLDGFLKRLPERERKILMMRYGLNDGRPMGLEEISKEVGLTVERVRQLESRALTRIRKMPGITTLYDYLLI